DLRGGLRMSAEATAPTEAPGPPRGGRVVKIVNPATGEPVRDVAEDSAEALARRGEKARRTQPEWAKLPLETRQAGLRAFASLVDRRREELATLLTTEMGKPLKQSRNEIIALQSRLRFFVDNVEAAVEDEVVFDERGWRERISYEPLGVVANISAWNYPYFVGSNVFVP